MSFERVCALSDIKEPGSLRVDGEVVAPELSPDGRTMTITQSGLRPDGTSFKNSSVYRRKINDG